MNRETFIEELHTIQRLLEGLRIRTRKTLKENRRIRKLLKLPDTVHNKTKLTNYLKNGTK
jgi:predicted nucleotidyltransferase